MAFTIPARAKREPCWFLRRTRQLTREFEQIESEQRTPQPILAEQQHEVVGQVQKTAAKVSTPLQRWESALERPIALFVLRIFALANAGVALAMEGFAELVYDPVVSAIVVGLVIGKAVGITSFCWLSLRLNLGHLPGGMGIGDVLGIGLLGGMGFTMSIFIASLSFAQQPELLVIVKTGILLASLLAGVAGYAWLRCRSRSSSNDVASV